MGVFESAQRTFRGAPSNKAAGAFLRALLSAEADDLIEGNAFLDGLVEITAYLEK
jgi:hypothetical protein